MQKDSQLESTTSLSEIAAQGRCSAGGRRIPGLDHGGHVVLLCSQQPSVPADWPWPDYSPAIFDRSSEFHPTQCHWANSAVYINSNEAKNAVTHKESHRFRLNISAIMMNAGNASSIYLVNERNPEPPAKAKYSNNRTLRAKILCETTNFWPNGIRIIKKNRKNHGSRAYI